MYKTQQNNDFYLASCKLYIFLQIVTRFLLTVYALYLKQIDFLQVPGIFIIGFINDGITLVFVLSILALLQLVFNFFCRNKNLNKLINTSMFLILATLMFCGILAELMFWDEFGTRFNFIAVDYIVYTHEIIGTLNQEMPLWWIVIPLIGLCAAIAFRYFLKNKKDSRIADVRYNIFHCILGSLLSIALFLFYNPQKFNLSSNVYAQELNKNGLYQLLSAFYNNSLNYFQFYPTKKIEEGFAIVRQNILQDNQKFISEQNSNIERITYPVLNTKGKNSNKTPNVVLIVVESMSAEFLQAFGNQQNITPFLNSLTDQSLFFTNYYATGTRTVRGLEALLLSTPPLPGASLIRKPGNNVFFTPSNIFSSKGYDVSFIYGGYGYFDNMLNFFKNNNYRCIDRSDFYSKEISFSNIWGVCDEDLFDKSIKYLDERHLEKQSFFSLILTTSNHRPYTFPSGKIDLLSGSNRAAAVKYTDYALKRFIEKARTKPWFDNTIFVITADHCASSAGKVHLPVHKYHIPLFIYAPGIISPKIVSTLCGQIDVMPTLLGILNFEYSSKFFGKDILNYPSSPRAFISTYQMLGYMQNSKMVVLTPKKKSLFYSVDGKEQSQIKDHWSLDSLLNEAVAFYQSAYSIYY